MLFLINNVATIRCEMVNWLFLVKDTALLV